MINTFQKWLGFVECENCHLKFIKRKNTSCGIIGNLNSLKTVYYCVKCSRIIMIKIFEDSRKNNPIIEFQKEDDFDDEDEEEEFDE